MSVTNTPRKAGPYTGNNTDVQYTFGFKVFADSDLVVTRAVIATGAESTLVLTTDYSVTRNADQDVDPGGYITLTAALADTYTLTLTSAVPDTQPAVFTNLGGFFPAVLNNALDRLTILVQQLKETVSRSLKLAVSTPTGFDATLPAPVAYGVLGFNGTADGFAVTDPSGSSALAGNLASSSSGNGSKLVAFIQRIAGAVARWVEDKLADRKHIKDFGAALDGVTNDDAAWTAALTWASANAPCELDCGGYGASKKTTTVLLPAGVTLNEPNLLIAANVVGLRFIGEARARKLKMRFSGTHTNNGVDIGAVGIDAGRSVIDGADIQGAGNDGIQVRNGNLGTLRDIKSISNGRDGINFTKETTDNNAWSLQGFIDIRGNTRDGLNFAQGVSAGDAYAPKSNQGGLITAQSNGRYGVYIGTRSNELTIYAESNTTADVFIDTYGVGNMIALLQAATVTDNGSGNVIMTHSMNADYVRGFKSKVITSGVAGKGLRVANDDGTAGYLDLVKSGDKNFQLLCDGASANQNLDIKNNNGSYFVNVKVWGTLTAVNALRVAPVTVANLPAAALIGNGGQAFVSDANATTFNNVVAGGGANTVPVFSDGTNWRIG